MTGAFLRLETGFLEYPGHLSVPCVYHIKLVNQVNGYTFKWDIAESGPLKEVGEGSASILIRENAWEKWGHLHPCSSSPFLCM